MGAERSRRASFHNLFGALAGYAESYGVGLCLKRMDEETPGEFDGLTITINPVHDLESRCYYLAHSVGSIVEWSLHFDGSKAVFDELRAARAARDRDRGRFERALQRFCGFEERASEYAVWVLTALGYHGVISTYTEFFRADIESMMIRHRQGAAPPWNEFFMEWKARVARGEEPLTPYQPRAVPPFRPVRIEKQEVVQEVDGVD